MGKNFIPLLSSSLSHSLRWVVVFSWRFFLPGGKLSGASMATTAGWILLIDSRISASLCITQVSALLPSSLQKPVGLVSTPAKSKPTINISIHLILLHRPIFVLHKPSLYVILNFASQGYHLGEFFPIEQFHGSYFIAKRRLSSHFHTC